MDAPAGGNSIVPTLADFILINEEIGAIVKARLPLEAYLARSGGELPGKAGELATRIGRRMERGESLSAAMDAECASLPAAYRAAIIAGVESGDLSGAIESLVENASRLEQLRRVTGLALLYPLMVIIIASALFAFLLAKVIPQFEWLSIVQFGPLTELSRSPWAVKFFDLVLPNAVVLLFLLWWWRSGRIASALAWLPGIRRVDHWSQAATLADMLRLLVERGLPLDRALTISADTVADPRMRAAASQLAARARQGGSTGPSRDELKDAERSGMPPLIRLALNHAADRRLMTAGLEEAATQYRERAIRAAEWYSEYAPIVLTLSIGGAITLAFTLVVFWPYTSMLHKLSDWNWK